MDLTMLLMTTSIFAGVHMMLFIFAATVALIYYRRCKKLQRQIELDLEAGREEAEYARQTAATMYNAGTTATSHARAERRQRRRREELRRQASEGVPHQSDGAREGEERDVPDLRPTTTRKPTRDAGEGANDEAPAA